MPPAKRRNAPNRATKKAKPQRRAAVKAAKPGRGHNKPPPESEALPQPMPPPMPSMDETASQIVRDTIAHRRTFMAAVSSGTVGDAGPPFAAARDPQLVLQHAREVERAIRELPPTASLAEADRREIRRALSVLTDGQVGGFKFKLKDRKAAKQAAWETLKRYAKIVGDKAAEQVGKRLGDAVVTGATVALWEALKQLLG
jgi:hypothetical protein